MAISKQRKQQLVDQYTTWMQNSQAMFITEYTGMTMKEIDAVRLKAREIGGEFHIMKNTLCKVAFEVVGLQVSEDLLQGSTAVAFAFQDPAAMAKLVTELARTSDFVKIKGGIFEKQNVDAEAVKTIGELPPLPILRGQLLGTLLAPASRLVRTLAEPARQLAAVVQAYANQETDPATA